MANKPTNPELYARVKSEAKSKFDVWPSAYGSSWLVDTYKKRGGGYRKAKDGMEVQGSINQMVADLGMMANGGIMYGDYKFPMMDEGGEMALGQIAAVSDKMSKLQQFLNSNSEVEPWVASKLAVMDDSAGAIYDYMMYNPEAQEQGEMEQMREGGIPPRYKNMGFNKVGVKKQSTRPGKKWMVLAKKDDKYKVVHGGYKGMKDFTQHGNEDRRDRFWDRMGGRNSAKATDPFSPLYWHKRFRTWAEGGEPQNEGFQALPQEVQAKIMANMMYGGDMYAEGGMPCYECGGQMKYKKGGIPFIATAYFGDGGYLPKAQVGTGCFKDNSAENAAYESQLDDFGKRKLAEQRSNLFDKKDIADMTQNTQMGPMLPDQQFSSDFSKFWERSNPFDKKDIAYMTQNRRGQPMDEDMYRLKKAAPEIMGALVDKGKDYLKDRYADYSTFGKGFKSATNTVGDLVSLGSWFGRGSKDQNALRDIQRRKFTDNMYTTMPEGVTGQRGDYDIMGNFRPDETLASRTYMGEAYMQEGGEQEQAQMMNNPVAVELELTEEQIKELVALGAEIEILN